MSLYANIFTGQMNVSELPTCLVSDIGVTQNPTMEDFNAAGWREQVSVDEPKAGDRVIRYAPYEIDGQTCKLVVAEAEPIPVAPTPEEIQAQRIATITPELWAMAKIYRDKLRSFFGPNAETNQAITEQIVFGYFATAQGLTPDQVRDGALIQNIFERIKAWTMDGTAWSFPWGQIPE